MIKLDYSAYHNLNKLAASLKIVSTDVCSDTKLIKCLV